MSSFLWAVCTALIWGVVPLVEKAGLLKISPMVGLFYRCMGVVVGIVFLVAWRGREIRASFSELHGGMLFLVLGGFLASVVGQIFFYHALKSGEASKVVPLAGAYPLVAFVLGVLVLGEKVTLAKAGGIALVVAGVLLLK